MTARLRVLLLLVLSAIACSVPAGVARAYSPQDGDVLFQNVGAGPGELLELATRLPWNHVGIVLTVDGQLQVLEALAPHAVQYTPLQAWLQRGDGGRHVAMRLRDPLDRIQLDALRKAARRYLGKSDDLRFDWGNEQIYCSELVWKLYRDAANIQLAPLQRLRDLELRNPVVKALLTERLGPKLPLDQPVVMPAALFKSKRLQTVAEQL